VNALDEVAEHGLRDVEIGDDAALHGPDGLDVSGRLAEHELRLGADGEHFLETAGVAVNGHDRGLAQDDPFAPHIDKGIRRAEVDGEIIRKFSENKVKKQNLSS
jgi:hypothetical protein